MVPGLKADFRMAAAQSSIVDNAMIDGVNINLTASYRLTSACQDRDAV
jgi:hypothetical protein